MLTPDQVRETYVKYGPIWLWLSPRVDTTPGSSSFGRVKLARSGNDPLGLLPNRVARPAQMIPNSYNGTYLGYVDDGVTEKFSLQYEPVPVAQSIIPYGVRISKDESTITARLALNNIPYIRNIFLPPGNRGNATFSWGGETSVPLFSLLLIIQNYSDPTDEIYECHLYNRGYFEPSQLVYGRQFNYLEMTYHSISALDGDTGCLLPPGSRTASGWYTRVGTDGVNSLVMPENPSMDLNQDSLAAIFPAYNFYGNL